MIHRIYHHHPEDRYYAIALDPDGHIVSCLHVDGSAWDEIIPEQQFAEFEARWPEFHASGMADVDAPPSGAVQ